MSERVCDDMPSQMKMDSLSKGSRLTKNLRCSLKSTSPKITSS